MPQESGLAEAAAQTDDLPHPQDIIGKDEQISIRDLFNASFMQEYTDFTSFDEMVVASPSDADSADELDLMPDGLWDEFVSETTRFGDEEEMVFAVRDHWVSTQLDL